MQKNWKHSWAAAIFGTTAFVTTSTSQAEVTVYWEEVTNGGQTDVVATWTGTLDPGNFGGDGVLPIGPRLEVASNGILVVSSDNPVVDGWYGGSSHVSGLAVFTTFDAGDFNSSVAGMLGFGDSAFYYPGIDNFIADTSLIDFDSTLHSLTILNTTLAGLNANSFSNTLAWTSSNGDTISYTTGSPPTGSISAIPEPSSGLVLGSLLLSGLMHRRRK